jgi:hypothetical protein
VVIEVGYVSRYQKSVPSVKSVVAIFAVRRAAQRFSQVSNVQLFNEKRVKV